MAMCGVATTASGGSWWGASGVSQVTEVSLGSSRRLLVGLWVTWAGPAVGLRPRSSEGAPTAVVVVLAAFVGALVLLPSSFFGRSIVRPQRPARSGAVRGDARREPLHGHRGDQGRRPRVGRGAAALARRHARRRSGPDRRVLAGPWRSPTARSGSAWRAGAGPSPSTRPTGRCSRRWPRSAPSPWPTPSSTPRSERQKEKLSVITSSLGEGVCAISETGEITFMNPAGASMLGWYGRRDR